MAHGQCKMTSGLLWFAENVAKEHLPHRGIRNERELHSYSCKIKHVVSVPAGVGTHGEWKKVVHVSSMIPIMGNVHAKGCARWWRSEENAHGRMHKQDEKM